MADLKKINLDGTDLNIVDDTARTTANGAASTAQTALNKVNEIEQLTRIDITYNATSSTMTITKGTHA